MTGPSFPVRCTACRGHLPYGEPWVGWRRRPFHGWAPCDPRPMKMQRWAAATAETWGEEA